MIGYHVHGRALGAYANGTDFFCGQAGGGNYVCQGRTPNVTSAYAELQQLVQIIATQMAAAGRLNVPANLAVIAVDGAIGKITAIGVQFIAAAFAPYKAPPAAVTSALSGTSAEQIVAGVAANAAEINAYFTDVFTNFPAAVTQEQQPLQIFPWGVVTASMAVLALLSIATYFAVRKPSDFNDARWF